MNYITEKNTEPREGKYLTVENTHVIHMRGFIPVGAIICFLRLFTMSRSLKRETKANWASMENFITKPQGKFVRKITH